MSGLGGRRAAAARERRRGVKGYAKVGADAAEGGSLIEDGPDE